MSTELRGLALLDAAIEHIEQHPETWTQSEYRCGSGMCLAGWIGELAGGRWAASADHWRGEWMVAGPDDRAADVDADSDYGPVIHIAERAERLIGVSRFLDGNGPMFSRDLFYGGNTLADIEAMRDKLRAAANGCPREEAGQ